MSGILRHRLWQCIMPLCLLVAVAAAASPWHATTCQPPSSTSSVLASVPASAPIFPQRPNTAATPNKTMWGSECRPLPTNTWWTNMMAGAGEFPGLASPYVVAALASGLSIGYPYPLTTTTTAIVGPGAVYPLKLSAVEGLKGRVVQRYDPLTVTLLWSIRAGYMTAPLAQGSPYITAIYSRLTPSIQVAIGTIASPAPGTYNATALTLTLSTGQRWRIYFARRVMATVSGTALLVKGQYTGGVRVALVPTSASLPRLDASSDAIPTRCALKSVTPSAGTAQYTFEWSVLSLRQPQNASLQPLLMLALPHHLDAKVRSSGGPAASQLRGAFRGLLGGYTGLLGSKWTISEKLPVVDWQAPRPPAASKLAALKAALASETDLKVSVPDPYFGTSQAAAIGQQALIADLLGENATATKLRASLKAELDKYLDTANATARLVYDVTFGGIVSAAGLLNPAADFGNGVYNDHHFHYGYLLYAAAALGAKDPAWLQSRKAALLNIVRDFANPQQGEPYFPFARQMDFYAGHSWSAGPVIGMYDVQNQESSSEAVHSYYSLALLGRALGDTKLMNWGRLLMAIEMRSAQKYYQVPSASTVWPEPFESNKVVGILWATKADYATFFGTNVEFIHCIQHIPYRPHTEALLPAAWINETLPRLLAAFTRTNPPIPSGFGAFVRLAQAVVDPEAAWQALQAWQWQWDGPHAALTRTAALWWAATRPGAA